MASIITFSGPKVDLLDLNFSALFWDVPIVVARCIQNVADNLYFDIANRHNVAKKDVASITYSNCFNVTYIWCCNINKLIEIVLRMLRET